MSLCEQSTDGESQMQMILSHVWANRGQDGSGKDEHVV